MAFLAPGAALHEAHGGVEGDHPPAAHGQLLAGRFHGAGLAENVIVHSGHLVAADDPSLRVEFGHRLGLVAGEAGRQPVRRFAGAGELVYPRGCHGEGQAQPLEQSAAVGGGGAKDKRGGAGHKCCQNNSQNKGLQHKAF